MKMQVVDVRPTNGRKSFGGKAKLIYDNETRAHYLRSYNTIVAGYVKGKMHRYWDGQSATTSAHLTAFFNGIIGKPMTIKEFYALKCEEAPTLAI